MTQIKLLGLVAYTISILVIVQAQIAEKYTQNPCVNKRNCHECIQTQSCAWCMQPDFGERPRCFQPSYTTLGACKEEFTWNPDNEQKLIINRELTRAGSRNAGGQMVYGGSYEANSSHSSSFSSHSSTSYGASSRASASGSSSGEIVQISPQRVNLKLRISKFLSTFWFLKKKTDVFFT